MRLLATRHSPLATEIDPLALAYQAGQYELLGELYRALQPQIAIIVRHTVARGLPSTLDARDLEQQSWLILADLARRWRPELGVFAAYVASSMPWALGRYVRRQLPTRRRANVQVVAVEGDELQRLLGEQAGEDGRAWDDRLVLQEQLARLPSLEQDVFTLRAMERRSFHAISTALEISASKAQRVFTRARSALRGERPSRPAAETDRDLERLVIALHQSATGDGRLPGRAWVCDRAGLSQTHYGTLMKRLVVAGCIHSRTERHPGRLVEREPEATLARVKSAK